MDKWTAQTSGLIQRLPVDAYMETYISDGLATAFATHIEEDILTR